MHKTHFFEEEIKKMQEWLKRLGYAEETIKGYINNLNYFFNWILKEEIDTINQQSLNSYNEYLHKRPIKRSTIQGKLNILKQYDKYLQKTENRKLIKEKLEIEETDLPFKREILSQKEIKNLYEEIEET